MAQRFSHRPHVRGRLGSLQESLLADSTLDAHGLFVLHDESRVSNTDTPHLRQNRA